MIKYLRLLGTTSDFTDHVRDFNDSRPYVIYIDGTTGPYEVYYSEEVLVPYAYNQLLEFHPTYSTISVENGVANISGAAEEFAAYDEDEKMLTFEMY